MLQHVKNLDPVDFLKNWREFSTWKNGIDRQKGFNKHKQNTMGTKWKLVLLILGISVAVLVFGTRW